MGLSTPSRDSYPSPRHAIEFTSPICLQGVNPFASAVPNCLPNGVSHIQTPNVAALSTGASNDALKLYARRRAEIRVPSRDLYPSPRHSACLRGTAPSASANAWVKPLPTVAALSSVKASNDVLKLTQYVVCMLGKSLGYVCILVSCHRRLIDRGLHAIRAGGGAK